MTRKSAKNLIRFTLLAIFLTASYYSTEMFAASRVLIVSLVGLLVVLTFAGLATHKARQAAFRIQHGLCAACGYDLRGTPSRCPECGTAATLRYPRNQSSS